MSNFSTPSEKIAAFLVRSTRTKTVLLSAFLVCVFSLGLSEQALAQPNCLNYTGPMITNFADWDWTIPTNHPNYCATWAVVLTSNPNTKLVVGAPWFGFQNGAVDKINVAQDYTKAKGWELLRMNMGGRQPIKSAHFILYNKYRGIIRIFFYVNNVADFTKGMTITMSHTSSNGSRNSGILALSQPLIQSQDYYLQNQSVNDEVVSYATVFTGSGGWVYGDFQAGFDSFAGNARYSSTSLQFAVSAVTSSTVRLDGKFNFQTKEDIETDLQTGGYAVGGRANNAGLSGLNNFLTKGQKVLKSFNYEDLTKFKSSFTTKANKTAATVPVPAVQAQQNALKNAVTSSSSSGSLLKKISGIAGSLGSAFGLISTVIGVLWPEEPTGAATTVPAPFIPTVSTGTLSLQGSISTSAPYTSLTMQIPGGQHYFPGSTGQTDGGNQPYYDCPLGIFNLKNTPQLAKYEFNVLLGQSFSSVFGYSWSTDYFDAFDGYRVTNDLVATYNDAAGLQLQSVQASLVVEATPDYFNGARITRIGNSLNTYDIYLPYTKNGILVGQVYSGEVEVVSANDSLVTYATPFVDLGNFKNQAISAPRSSKVYVRIKALLQRKDSGINAPPVFFVQDYVIQPNLTTVATNPRFSTSQTGSISAITGGQGTLNVSNEYINGVEPPYTNLASALIVPSVSDGFGGTFEDFTSTAPYVAQAGTYTSPLVLSSLTTISNNFRFNVSIGDMELDHPNVTAPSLFLSTTGVALGPGFSVTPGTNFVAATPLQAWRQGGPAIIEPFTGPCNYNTNTSYNPVAYRGTNPADAPGTTGATVLADALTVSPNPTDGLVTIATAVAGETEAVVVVSDYMGKEVQRIETIPAGLSNQQINLAGKASGLYLIRLITSGKTVTQKVLLQ